MNFKKTVYLSLALLVVLIAIAAIFPSIAAIPAGLIMILIPIIAAIAFHNHAHIPWKIFLLGMAAFIVSQIGHLPFNQLALAPLLTKFNLTLTAQATTGSLLLVSLAYGLSAGIFEEVIRYLWYRFFLKENRTWNDGIMLGLGHGGVEAIILGISVLLTFIQIMALKNTDLAILGDQAQAAEQAITSYLNTDWHQFLLGSFERFSAVILHLGLSVIVLQVFRKNKPSYLFLAIAIHTFVDAFAVFASLRFNVLVLEALVFLFALLTFLLALSFRKSNQAQEALTAQTDPSNAVSPEKVIDLTEIQESLAHKQNQKNSSEIEDSHYE